MSGRKPGAKQKLLSDLAALDYCEATPADNQNILILITDIRMGIGLFLDFGKGDIQIIVASL